jgi:hypothetical protein
MQGLGFDFAPGGLAGDPFDEQRPVSEGPMPSPVLTDAFDTGMGPQSARLL